MRSSLLSCRQESTHEFLVPPRPGPCDRQRAERPRATRIVEWPRQPRPVQAGRGLSPKRCLVQSRPRRWPPLARCRHPKARAPAAPGNELTFFAETVPQPCRPQSSTIRSPKTERKPSRPAWPGLSETASWSPITSMPDFAEPPCQRPGDAHCRSPGPLG